jgi:hypothetical protein
MQSITKKNMRDQFLCICVDTHRQSLPHFVDRVPFVISTQNKHLKDEHVGEFIASLAASRQEEEVAPTELGSSGMADGFSYLDETISSFGNWFVPVDCNPRIYAPDESTNTNANTNSSSSSSCFSQNNDSGFLKMQEHRDADLSQFRQQQELAAASAALLGNNKKSLRTRRTDFN